MKKITFRGSQSSSIRYLVPSHTRKHAGILVYTLIVLIGALLTQACRQRIAPANELGSLEKPSSDSIITKPGSSTGPSGPVGIFKTIRITLADTDYQMIQFDAAGKPVQYSSQYLFNRDKDEVQRSGYGFQYGPDGRLTRISRSGGGYVLYKYEDETGGLVQFTEEYTANGDQWMLRSYRYSDDNRLIEVDQLSADGSPATRRTFRYDVRGNLSLVSDFVMNRQFNFVLETTTSFEDYDQGKQVENLLTEFPFLPGVSFRANNFRTKVVRAKDGREISRETYAYTYNEQGLPVQKVRRIAGETFTASYTY